MSEVFKNWETYAKEIKKLSTKILGDTHVYGFGSVIKKKYSACSDIDILICSSSIPEKGLRRAEIIAEIRKELKLPYEFELHLLSLKKFKVYKKMFGKLKEIK